MKKLTLIMTALLLLLMTGCSLEPPEWAKPKAAANLKDIKIGLSISTLNNPFFVSLKDGVVAEAKNKECRLLLWMHKMIRRNKVMTWMI